MKIVLNISIIVLWMFALFNGKLSCNQSVNNKQLKKKDTKIYKEEKIMTEEKNKEVAVFGAGCFWCVEAVFQELKGVYKVESGYTGGTVKNPTYNEICTGETGHAEVARISYNPDVVDFAFLLSVFFKTHDPTTLNAQGADRGTQYRSAIFFTSEKQREIAQNIINQLNTEKAYPNPIVTEVTQLGVFYKAENYHQDYYKNNPRQGYCTYVIQPKVEKFRKVFKNYLK
jgi:peptide-methionine (S)-S-oxide reductase